ncbi:hypothetical protein [Marinobacter sp.]|uniref:hypothetical protein n=1 Tax=Marinobacter sp. TaxID=50741 RepID=UPI00356A2C8D
MKDVIAALAIALAAPAMADSYIYTGAWSQHFSGKEYNETNRMLAVAVDGYMAGYFRNSYDEDAFMLARQFTANHGDIQFGVSLGAVYGYRHCLKGWSDSSRRVCPLAVPSVTYTGYPVQPSLMLVGEALAISIRTDLSIFGGAK